jgi:hypothetical protein
VIDGRSRGNNKTKEGRRCLLTATMRLILVEAVPSTSETDAAAMTVIETVRIFAAGF